MKTTAFLLLISAMVAVPGYARAQNSPSETSGATQTKVDHQSPTLRVTQYSLPPEKLAKAEALYLTSTVLYLFGMIFGLVVLWLLLRLRVAPIFRDFAERVSKNKFLQTLIFVPLLMILIAVTSLPLEMYEHHVSLSYGLSVQGWGSWAGDWLKGEAVFLVIAIVAVFALFWVIDKSPRRWWFHFWLMTLPFIVLLVFIAPVVLDPMFNTFVPLEKTQPQLVMAIEKVAHRGGLNIPPDRMFEMKASDKVTTYNAYVTGIGATKRVVVWDNTARDMSTPEILFVFGHEMGHYILNHIHKGLAFFAALSFAGFWLGRKIVIAMLSRWGDKWRIRNINDLAALPVFLLTVMLLTVVSEPIDSAFSRHREHQADIYGLEVTHGLFPDNQQVAADSFQKLGEKSYDYPTPNRFMVFWSYDHPTIQQRIRFALHYNPWGTSAGPKYVK
ncbi:MAG: M48 family metallopeptidase [Candidatus Sulfotelmatobacter sp.]